MTTGAWWLDASLAVTLPILAWRAIAQPELRKAIVLFIAFGLLSALAWARLAAADIALVEAAVGAGLTGTLLMSCIGWLDAAEQRTNAADRAGHRARAALVVALIAGLALSLADALRTLAQPTLGLSAQVDAELERSGVVHPVTAVLLNFRGLDTLLEVVVLLVAAVGVQSLRSPDPRAPLELHHAPLLDALVNLLAPGFVLVGGYVLWKGSHAAGGAFQAAAVLAGGGVLWLLARRAQPPAIDAAAVRTVLLAGPALYWIIAAAPLVAARPILQYPQAWAGTLIVLLESVLTLSIAWMLVLFVPLGVGTGSSARASDRGAR